MVEPGHIISAGPAFLLRPKDDWQDHVHGLLSWMKSSFFLWYCAVRLGDDDLFVDLLGPRPPIVFPTSHHPQIYDVLDRFGKSMILAENKFMNEVNGLAAKGQLGESEREKLRRQHNDDCDNLSRGLDNDIFQFLGMTSEDVRSVANTIRDLRMTEFGLLNQLRRGRE